MSGNQVTSGESFRRSYWNFFPNLSIVADLADGNHSISLDFSRSIVRPFYSDLNPFRIWTSENTYTSGNIHLDPMVYNDMDLSWFFCGDYIIGAYYSYGTDAFSQYLRHDERQHRRPGYRLQELEGYRRHPQHPQSVGAERDHGDAELQLQYAGARSDEDRPSQASSRRDLQQGFPVRRVVEHKCVQPAQLQSVISLQHSVLVV